MRRAGEFGAALALLTRLPGGWLVRGAWPESSACVWAFPAVGLIVGLIGAAVLYSLERAGVPALPAAATAIAATILATGGLHEDGLADMADGLGVRSAAARLAVMRDSRIGAHGAGALGLALLVRAGTLGSLDAGRGAMAMMAASAVGRGAILLVMAGGKPARTTGLGASIAGAGRVQIALGLLSSVGIAAALESRWPAMVVAGLGLGWAVSLVARRSLGGYTGDVLGAASVLAECGALLAASAH